MGRAFILVNRRARGGAASSLWSAVKPLCEAALEGLDCRSTVTVELDETSRWREELRAALGCGTRTFVAAGGDGTVGALVNELAEHVPPAHLPSLRLGAVGLGSSNDLHKPAGTRDPVPLRLSLPALPRDLCTADYRAAATGERGRRRFLVSASLGLLAEGNARFNTPGAMPARLKRWSVPLAIGWAGAAALLSHRPRRLSLRPWSSAATFASRGEPGAWGERDEPGEGLLVDSLSVLKTPYLTGGLRCELPVEFADGRLHVAAFVHEGRWSAVRTVRALSHGVAGRHCRYLATERLAVAGERPFDLECDGELVGGLEEVHFSVGTYRIGVLENAAEEGRS